MQKKTQNVKVSHGKQPKTSLSASLLRKVVKVCGTPEDFCFDYIDGASIQSDIRRMKEYVNCVKNVCKKK